MRSGIRHELTQQTTTFTVAQFLHEFFQLVHASHLFSVLPSLMLYVALAPGWRVLLAPDQIEVRQAAVKGRDATMLDVAACELL